MMTTTHNRRWLARVGAGLCTVALAVVTPVVDGAPPAAASTAAERQAAFHRAATQDFLGRQPSGTEINHWVSTLVSGADRGEFLRALAHSDAWIGNLVNRYYRDTLGRAPDSAGRSYWIGQLRTGALTPAEVASLFYASDEYFAHIGGGTHRSWVEDLYGKLLARQSEPAGKAYWVDVAARYGRSAVTFPFYQSTETRQRRVTVLYHDLLGRGPDPSGLGYWVDVVGHSGNDLTLAMHLASSAEYFDRAQRRYPGPNPVWVVGAAPLPVRPDGYAHARATPAVLIDRRLPTTDRLAPPAGGSFQSSISTISPAVRQRMGRTWQPGCPVPIAELRYLRVSFIGFDGRAHTGEIIVHASVANDVVSVFRTLFAARYPIEEMRIVTNADLDAPPTGDGNNTVGFVCRPVVGGSGFSQHAYGKAIDLNPFHNPYRRGDLLLPELASSYLDRGHHRPGMIARGDVVHRAFADIGWHWGGDWTSLRDYHHFSHDGR